MTGVNRHAMPLLPSDGDLRGSALFAGVPSERYRSGALCKVARSASVEALHVYLLIACPSLGIGFAFELRETARRYIGR